MKIVVLDGYTENPGDLSWAPLEKYGELTVYDRTSYVDSPLIAERIGDAEIVIINKTPIMNFAVTVDNVFKRYGRVVINARTSNSLQFWRQDTT